MKVLRIVLVVALVAVGVGAVGFVLTRNSRGTTATSQYLTATASHRDVVNTAVADGSVSAATSYALSFGSAPVPTDPSSTSSSSSGGGASGTTWRVTTVKVAAGDAVTEGQVLAVADTADLRTQLATANRQLHSARLRVDAAQETYDGIASGQTDALRQAEIQLLDARAQRDQASQSAANLETEIAYATVKAPVAGIVTAVNVHDGTDAPSGAAIVMAVTPLQITANFAESDLAVLENGQAASVAVKALAATVSGRVASISPEASSSSGGVVSYTVTISVDNPPAGLRSGMSAEVSITTASASNVLAVPTAALQNSGGAYAVQILDANGQPVAEEVSVGLVTSTFAEITAGLNDGDRVVIGTSTQRQTGLPGFPVGGGGGGGRFTGGGNQGGGNQGGGTQGGGTTP